MTKIFATKALSMVLCFVMLFMGAPVTTWAEGETAITVQKGEATVTGNDIMLNSVDAGSNTLTLTATGFTDSDGADNTANVEWSLSTNAGTWVSLRSTTGAETILTLNALPAFDTKVKVTAKTSDPEQATSVDVSLQKPKVFTELILPEGLTQSASKVSTAPLTGPSTEPYVLSFKDIASGVTWKSVDEDVAYFDVNEGDLFVKTAGDTVITATYYGKTVAFLLTVASGIDHISLYDAENDKLADPANVAVGDKITAKVFGDVVETTELNGAGVDWSVKDENDADVTSFDCTIDGSSLTFSTAGTYKVTATSTFDTSQSVEQQITVDEVESVPPTIEANKEGAVAPGDEIAYTIIYKNYTSEAADVTITSTLDPNVEFLSASDGWIYDEAAHTVTWTLSDVAAGDIGTVILTVKVLAGALESNDGPGKVSASATVQVGGDAGLNTDTVEHTVEVADGIVSVEDSEGNAVVDGGSFELDSFGNGKLTVTIEPEDATVTVKVNGEVNEAVASYEKGVININEADDGDTRPLAKLYKINFEGVISN